MSDPLEIAGTPVAPGSRATLAIPVARRYSHNEVMLPVEVVRGRKDGPRLFLSAAVHGDEINGTEIIRRLLRMPVLRRLRGSLIAVPIVNVYGFVANTRYLPDRRDLNRSFPGSASGSLAARLAHQFMTEVVNRCTHGIDLHTGAIHRSNLPQIRACLDDPETERLARAFGTPVLVHAALRDGSLRQSVYERGIPMLVYEAGEALRFDEVAIRAGLRGVISVMRALGMLPPSRTARKAFEPFVARSSSWVRAPDSGILRTEVTLGDRVEKDEKLGVVWDPLGTQKVPVVAPGEGIVIGRTMLPLVNEGDALFHVASFHKLATVAEEVEAFQEEMGPNGSNA